MTSAIVKNLRTFQLLLKGCTIEALLSFVMIVYLYVSVVVERMYDWSLIGAFLSIYLLVFQLLLKGCTIEAEYNRYNADEDVGFSCCWKDVRLKRMTSAIVKNLRTFQLLLKGCTIEALLSFVMIVYLYVSVVVERMYDWSFIHIIELPFATAGFSCCWKDVRLKQHKLKPPFLKPFCFSCCWKDVRLKQHLHAKLRPVQAGFSCCWKDVRLKHSGQPSIVILHMFQLLLKGCTIEAMSVSCLVLLSR